MRTKIYASRVELNACAETAAEHSSVTAGHIHYTLNGHTQYCTDVHVRSQNYSRVEVRADQYMEYTTAEDPMYS